MKAFVHVTGVSIILYVVRVGIIYRYARGGPISINNYKKYICVSVDRAFVVLYVFSINTCPTGTGMGAVAITITITITVLVLRHCTLREYNSYYTCTVKR
jgi:hypothetical protein